MQKNIMPWFSREIDDFFDMDSLPRFPLNYVPAMDVYESGDHIVAETPLAGVEPEKVSITIENNVLTIRGKTEEKQETQAKDYYRKEIRTGEFVRSVELPVAVKASEAKASSKNGMLKILLPKAEEAKPKTVKVEISN